MSATDYAGPGGVPEFVRRFQPPFPVGYNPSAESLAYLQVPIIAPGFVPKMAFIDRQGVIREQHDQRTEDPYFKTPEASIRNSLDELLKKPAPAKKSAPRSRPKTK